MAQIKVTYPYVGLILREGSTYEIKWEIIENGTAITNCDIRLYKNAVFVETIISAFDAHTMSYFWKIGEAYVLDDDYTIQIRETAVIANEDTTDEFEIAARKAIEDFNDLNDFEKVILVELKAGIDIAEDGWTLVSDGYHYISYTGPELVDIEYNGTKLTRKRSAIECRDEDYSYYHDIENQILYINLYVISPEESGVFLIGYTWLCFTNSQHNEYMVDYTPQNAWYSNFYMPFLDVSNIPSITQKVQEYYTQAVTTQFGSLKFNNDGWWWTNKLNYLWHNKEIWVKFGEKGSQYDEFVSIFPGRTRKPDWGDREVIINVKDKRAGILKEIPVDRFDIVTYPNMEEPAENKPIPILFGIKNGLIPVCIDETTFKYKISQTTFNGNAYPIQSVDNVYLSDVEIFLTTNYTVDLANGEITLVDDPGDASVTVNAHGIKCQYDFSDGSQTTTFTENVADILFFILIELNEIAIDDIDLDSFDDLQTQRTQRLGWYLNKAVKTTDFIRTLQMSALFHFIPNLDGRFLARYYDRDTPTDALRFKTEDYTGFRMPEDTDSCFEHVVLNYDKEPTKDEWKVLKESWAETGYKHDEHSTFTVNTALVDSTEAQNLIDYYVAIVKYPGKKITTGLKSKSLELIPGDKAYFSRTVVDGNGNEITILDEEVYLFLSIVKDINRAQTKIIALEDSQAKGQAGHADIAHTDSYTDEHTDEHTDSAHTDSAHTDTHTNTAYVDTYTDYTDEIHNDETYSDHEDIPYVDSHLNHTDDPFHLNEYVDLPYTDHDDNPYTDHTDGPGHTDNHTNTPYVDSHGDIPHGDGYDDEYSDEHSDVHGDIPHTDSET